MPLEFARISKDGRLTLVVYPTERDKTDSDLVWMCPTYWAESSLLDVDVAREDLRKREGPPSVDAIHAVGPNEKVHHPEKSGVEKTVIQWLQGRFDIDAAVWTGLRSNWKAKRGGSFSIPDALDYIREVETKMDRADAAFAKLREYIRNAPIDVDTELRRRVVPWKNWDAADLPEILFETESGRAE